MSSPRDHSGSEETDPRTESDTDLYDTPRTLGHDDFKQSGVLILDHVILKAVLFTLYILKLKLQTYTNYFTLL